MNIPSFPNKEEQINKTLRLTFHVAYGKIHLESHERIDMICPPSVGERPQAGINGGFWIELRDSKDNVIFHRVLNNPLGDSIEVHSQDGNIKRIFGDVKENVFDVLLPDINKSKTIVLMGESLEPSIVRKEKTGLGAKELAYFNVPENNEKSSFTTVKSEEEQY